MNKVSITIWGRAFQLPVCLECYDDEEILITQQDAYTQFFKDGDHIEQSKAFVEEYLISKNPSAFPDRKVDSIFKYVMPTSIFVPHNKAHPYVILLCNYKFDSEHGLAIVYEDNIVRKVCSEDLIL